MTQNELLEQALDYDVPMGHDSLIIGLTDREYEKIDNMNIDQIIDFAKKSLLKVKNYD